MDEKLAVSEDLPAILQSPPWATAGATRDELPDLGKIAPPPFAEILVWRRGEKAEWAARWQAPEPQDRILEQARRFQLFIPRPIPELAELFEADRPAAEELIRQGAQAKARDRGNQPDYIWSLGLMTLLMMPRALRRPLIDLYPPDLWWCHFDDGEAERLIAEQGLELFDFLLGLARTFEPLALAAFAPVASPRLAPIAVEQLGKKKGRAPAIAWLERQPEAAMAGLLPLVVNGKYKHRDLALEAFHLVARRLDADTLLAVADRGGEEVGSAARAVLALDPRDIYPKKLPKMPDFWQPEGFTAPRLRTGEALSPAAIEHLGTMLAFTPTDIPYAGVFDVQDACDSASLAAFSWDLFSAWKEAGMAAKESWAFTALGFFGDDEAARRLTPFLRAWPGEGGHQRAVTGLEVLSRIGTDVALMHLNGIALKLKFKGLQAKAREKIGEIAERRGLSREQLSDRLVPSLGLDPRGLLELDFGPRRFKVGFDEQLRPLVQGDDGKIRKSLPKPRKDDDSQLAKEAADRFKALKKDVRALAGAQIARLERAMCLRRRWSEDDFRRFLVEHPLLGHLVKRLIWGVYGAGDILLVPFRVDEDGAFVDSEDEPFDPEPGGAFGLVHPVELTADLHSGLSQELTDYEIVQPFRQLTRSVFALSDAEKQSVELGRWHGRVVPTGRLLGLEKIGWNRGAPQDAGVSWWYERPVPIPLPGAEAGDGEELEIVLTFEPGVPVGSPLDFPEQTLRGVWITRGEGGWGKAEIPLSRLDAITASEVVADLEELTRAV